MRADNGPPFNSASLKQYLEGEGIQLSHSAPYSPWQNGEVERANKDLKRNILINHSMGADWRVGLLDFLFMQRTSPHSVTGVPPLTLMMNRAVCDKLP